MSKAVVVRCNSERYCTQACRPAAHLLWVMVGGSRTTQSSNEQHRSAPSLVAFVLVARKFCNGHPMRNLKRVRSVMPKQGSTGPIFGAGSTCDRDQCEVPFGHQAFRGFAGSLVNNLLWLQQIQQRLVGFLVKRRCTVSAGEEPQVSKITVVFLGCRITWQ